MKNKYHMPLNFIERKNSKISLLCSIAALIFLFLTFYLIDYNLIRKPAILAQKQAEAEKKEEEKYMNTTFVSEASVIAVGDNLYHGTLLDSGKQDTGAWNYDHIYQHVLPEIQAADIALIDQETVLTTDHTAVSSYPSFATPTEVGDAIIKAGFNVIESASNHIDDYGYVYMEETLNFWKTNYPEALILGVHETEEDADAVKTKTVNDITFAFLDYTYGTNGAGAGEGKEFMIDVFDKDRVTKMVKKAKECSDVVIFVAHWGNEDQQMPSEYEKEWATFLMQQGVDVVIGGHPHVIQPYGTLSDEQGNSMLIYYSLGNFVSTQQEMPELLEGMASFKVRKTTFRGETTIEILEPELKPMVMHYNDSTGEYGPYMMEDYTEELASQHSIRELIGDKFTLENLKALFSEVLSVNVMPSDKTYLLNVSYEWDGSMIDKTSKNQVDDVDSITLDQYLSKLGVVSVLNGGSGTTTATTGAADTASSSGSNDSYNDSNGSYSSYDSYYNDSYSGYSSYNSYNTYSYDSYGYSYGDSY
ncbi:MAG: CapA family protein [Blautia sp.]|nr:CapA family protein [Blautia sp.]